MSAGREQTNQSFTEFNTNNKNKQLLDYKISESLLRQQRIKLRRIIKRDPTKKITNSIKFQVWSIKVEHHVNKIKRQPDKFKNNKNTNGCTCRRKYTCPFFNKYVEKIIYKCVISTSQHNHMYIGATEKPIQNPFSKPHLILLENK